MLRLLIADDEKVIRESLMECLNWEEIGIEVVACCANGLEALDAIIDESPDIVLTDIKMPGLTGLELIEKMQEIDRDIEFIILSGYQEFSFAKKAIELGVGRYLLKPVSEEQVLEAVKGAMESGVGKKAAKAAAEAHQQLCNQVEQYYRKQVQYAYFLQGSALEQAVSYYERQFPAHKSNNQILKFSALSLEEATGLTKRMHCFFRAENIVLVTDFLFSKGLLLVMIHHENTSSVQRLTLWLQEQREQIPYQQSRLGSLLACVEEMSEEPLRYARTSAIDCEGNVMEVYNTGLSLEGIQALLEQLILLAKSDNRPRAAEEIKRYFLPMEDFYNLRASCAHLLSGTLLHKHLSNANTGEYQGAFDKIYQENEKERIISLVEEVVLALLWEEDTTNDMIQKVKAYVNQSLSDSNLSLKRIAAEVIHVNVDYLSRLFVQETGEKFSYYLNHLRVEKAKKLLQQDSSKIYLVAEQVGLGHNPRYFSQVFRKYERMTPSAYVEQMRKGEELE